MCLIYKNIIMLQLLKLFYEILMHTTTYSECIPIIYLRKI